MPPPAAGLDADLAGMLAPPQGPEELGRLGPYRVLGLLGQGGMGVVFRAEDPRLQRPVALKVMRPALASNPANCARFLREARIAAALTHDHIVTIYQCAEDRGIPFLVMQLLQGESLEGRLRREGRLEPAEAARIGRDVAEGLAAAHARGLVHRDVKPGNVFIEAPSGRVRVLDFGLARAVQDDMGLTQSGALVGSPGYVAPEQVRGGPAHPRSDLFSLGCVLYRALTGRLPFTGPDTLAILSALAVQAPTPVRELSLAVPPALAELVMRLLEKDPARRPPSARAVADALAALGRGPPLALPAESVRAVEPIPPADTLPELIGVLEASPSAAASEPSGMPQEDETAPIGLPADAKGRSVRRWLLAGALLTLLGLLLILIGVAGWRGNGGVEQVPDVKEREIVWRDGRTYLSDLKEFDVKAGPWPFSKNGRHGGDGQEPIAVGGKPAPKGLSMHPPTNDFSRVRYRLARQAAVFEATVALADSRFPVFGVVGFEVLGDGRLLWKSEPMRQKGVPQSCRVSVKGVDVLELRTTIQGDQTGAHAVWIDPCVRRADRRAAPKG